MANAKYTILSFVEKVFSRLHYLGIVIDVLYLFCFAVSLRMTRKEQRVDATVAGHNIVESKPMLI